MMVPKKVLADTSFLIALLNKQDDHHTQAVGYFTFLIENGSTFYLSSIVEAELQEDLADTELPLLNSLRRVSFTHRDGQLAAKLRQMKQEASGGNRDAIKDDIKILANAITNKMDAIITADKDSITKIFEKIHPSSVNNIVYLPITIDHMEAFDIPLVLL